MGNDVKISVVIPVYNGEETLRECLDSVLSQNFSDYEIIVVNDGSTDGTLDILNAYAKEHAQIKVLSHENKGILRTRQAGYERAEGDYICQLDADDMLTEGALEQTYAYAESHKIDLLSFNYCDLKKNELIWRHGAELKCGWSKLWKQTVLEQIPFQELPDLVYFDDLIVHFYCDFLNLKTAHFNDRYFYIHRVNPHSVTETVRDRFTDDAVQFYQYMIQAYENRNSFERLLKFHEWFNFLIIWTVNYKRSRNPAATDRLKAFWKEERLNVFQIETIPKALRLQAQLKLGKSYYEDRQWTDAVLILQDYLSKSTGENMAEERSYALRMLAASYEALNLNQEAKEALYKAIDECSYVKEPYVALMKLLYKTNSWLDIYRLGKKALTIAELPNQKFKEAAAQKYDMDDAIALAAYHLGLFEEAVYHGKKALEQRPRDFRLKTNLAFYEEKIQ